MKSVPKRISISVPFSKLQAPLLTASSTLPEMTEAHANVPNEGERMKAQLIATGSFPVFCAWCSQEGSMTVVGYTRRANSHGICPAHRDVLRSEMAALISAKRDRRKAKVA